MRVPADSTQITEILSTARILHTDHPELTALGYRPTFYAIPEVNAELKLALYSEQQEDTSTGATPSRNPGPYVTPFNARHQNTQRTRGEGASTLRIRIVPVPAPGMEEPGA